MLIENCVCSMEKQSLIERLYESSMKKAGAQIDAASYVWDSR